VAEHERDLLVGTDAEHFAAQTIRVLRDGALRERLARSARRLVERDHSWERCVRDLETLYERALRP